MRSIQSTSRAGHELDCLTTPSVVLRHFLPTDAPAVMHLNAEDTTRRWLPSHVYADLVQARAAVAYLIASYSSPGDPRLGPYVLAIEARSSAQLLGHVGFSPLDHDVEVSYAIAEQARGRGYGAEALLAACHWAAAAFGLSRIVALTASVNLPSRRTLDAAGFALTGSEVFRFQGVEQEVCRYVLAVEREGAQSEKPCAPGLCPPA
jgi:RimJ/RimL family protein N-acetyltransferase